MTESIETEPFLCQGCGYKADNLMPVRGRYRAGSVRHIAVCLNCGSAQIRDAAGWRLMTVADRVRLSDRTRRSLTELQIRHAEGKRLGIIPDLVNRDGHA